MIRPRISANWLSDEMANALAAMCPPLQSEDVRRAADTLSSHVASSGMVMLDRAARPEADPVNLQNVIEALHALHDFGRQLRN